MPESIRRRDFLTATGLAAATGVVSLAYSPQATASAVPGTSADRAWNEAAAILRRVRPPVFPDREFDITRFGAVGDGETDCTGAIRAAIAECGRSGGGRVVVPAGTFATGAVHLISNTNLYLSHGATLAFSRDPAAYLPVVHTRYEGVELWNYSPLVYAHGARNVAITGTGVIDGRADDSHWWNWTNGPPPNEGPDKTLLNEMADAGVPVAERVFGEGHYLRPNMVQFYSCENVLIEGITLRDSPMWNLHPVLSRNVTVRSVVIDSPHGPNNDGIDPESCSDVVIRDCVINTGDDCVALKAGKNADGRRVNVACENVVVLDCEMADGNGGVTIGSETSGGVRNLFVRRCEMSSPRLERAVRIKSNPERGGTIENVYIHQVNVGQAADAVVEMVLNYANVTTGDFHPNLHGILISQLTAANAPRALNMLGNDGHPIRDIRLHACRFDNMSEPNIVRDVEGLVLDQVWVNDIRIDS
ncbi:Tat (twin-arginine translocation) pathway signal sequence [Amycolatopsis marina]|uniref:Tat (Twin-arginine translocation) pathway signal sequence n=1 Tax=Amycolatopsis marina TaxID=490629 RepID=A0A1I1BRA3_9PSEU|nr:glycoside hydrolase family 28 protein [Amycolatopsis marina]SFB52984.1 Tat (twin-arginine translocation) pathway signal sequence [Amycolatopsis marina]